jgi:iron-sulfur cluster assembly accessory protein
MITITPTAVEELKRALKNQSLRLAVQGGGCSGFQYAMSPLQPGTQPGTLDKLFSFDGLTVHIDQASLMYLDGLTLDYVTSLQASGFTFTNPNVKSTCGCGSSFNA